MGVAFDGVDIDLAGDDLQRAKDEKLLELLGEMAKGASDDEDPSSNVLNMLPIEVQADDPATRALLEECGTMLEEVQAEAEAKQELRARLLGELQQIQDRSDRQYQESSALQQRLMSAKQMLGEKLKEASSTHQDLKDRIGDEWRSNERLRSSMSDGVKDVMALADELNRQILEVGEDQALLVEELQAATEVQARLQSELQEERVHTWRQSTDVVMAFARGSTPSAAPAPPASLAAPEDSGGPLVKGDSKALALPVPNRREGGPPPTSTWSPQDLQEKGGEDFNAQLWTERSTLLRTKVVGSEQQAEIKRQCCRQAQRVAELSKELALEETSRTQLDLQLQDVMARVEECGLELRRGEEGGPDSNVLERLQEWHDGLGFDVLGQMHEVEELRQYLQHKEAECRRAAEEQREAREVLEAEQAELEALRARLAASEGQSDDNAHPLADAAVAVDLLRGEVQEELALLQETEQHAASERRAVLMQMQQHRDDLQHLCAENRRLAIELEAREATGCFRRRAVPSGPVRREATPRRGAPSPHSSPGPRAPGGQGKGKSGGKQSGQPKGVPKGSKGGPPGGSGGRRGKGGLPPSGPCIASEEV